MKATEIIGKNRKQLQNEFEKIALASTKASSEMSSSTTNFNSSMVGFKDAERILESLFEGKVDVSKDKIGGMLKVAVKEKGKVDYKSFLALYKDRKDKLNSFPMNEINL